MYEEFVIQNADNSMVEQKLTTQQIEPKDKNISEQKTGLSLCKLYIRTNVPDWIKLDYRPSLDKLENFQNLAENAADRDPIVPNRGRNVVEALLAQYYWGNVFMIGKLYTFAILTLNMLKTGEVG